MKRRTRLHVGRRGIFAVLALAAWALAATACEDPPPPSDARPAPTSEPRACRTSGPRYLAYLATGACSDVTSPRSNGAWIAHALFPGAPPAIRDSACAYEWTLLVPLAADGSVTAPDLEALAALPTEQLTRDVETRATAPCEATLLPATAAQLVPPVDASGGAGPTGVSGCDVCARLVGRTLFVILPADKLDLHTVVVTTDDGKDVLFDVHVPNGTQAFAVELPSPQQGRYNEGRVPLFRAPL